MKTTAHRISPPSRAQLRRTLDRALEDQNRRFGNQPWTPREFDLIDQAQAAVDAAVQAADPAAFDRALTVFLRRTTPLDVLLDAVAADNVAAWCAVAREGAERGAWGSVLTIPAAKTLDGADLVLRAVGDPQPGEWAIEDLPALLGAAEAATASGETLSRERMAALSTMRQAFGGNGAQLVGFIPEVKAA